MGSLTIIALCRTARGDERSSVGVPFQTANRVELVPAYVGPDFSLERSDPALAASRYPNLFSICRDALRVSTGDWVAFSTEQPPAPGSAQLGWTGELSHGLESLALDVIVGRSETSLDAASPANMVPAGPRHLGDMQDEDLGWLLDRIDGRIYRRSTAQAALSQAPQSFALPALTPFILNAGVALSGSGTLGVLPTVSDVILPFPDAWFTAQATPTASQARGSALASLRFCVDLLDRLAHTFNLEERSYFHTKCLLLKALDATAPESEEVEDLRRRVTDIAGGQLRRIVMLTGDLSSLGGIQNRTRKVLAHATDRDTEYVGLSVNNEHGRRVEGNICLSDDPERVRKEIASWHPADTAIIFPNNTLRLLPSDVRADIDRFPLVFLGSGQFTYMLQDSHILADVPYVRSLKASKIVLLSAMDQQVYRQLGVYDHVRGFNPVQVRQENEYCASKNVDVGYVGRIDFHTKGAERLVEAAAALKALDWRPLRIFTVSSRKNSPDLERFLEILDARGLRDAVSITFDETDLSQLYGQLQLLLLPSKKDSFPNVILEANSFGVPVVAMSYAPGPAEVIRHGETGFLLDDFTSSSLAGLLSELSQDSLQRMSERAFQWHKRFDMESYCELLEGVCANAVHRFAGQNLLRVYPELKPINKLYERSHARAETHSELKSEHRRLKEERRQLRKRVTLAEGRARALQASYRYRLGCIVAHHTRSLPGLLTMPLALWKLYASFRRTHSVKPPGPLP